MPSASPSDRFDAAADTRRREFGDSAVGSRPHDVESAGRGAARATRRSSSYSLILVLELVLLAAVLFGVIARSHDASGGAAAPDDAAAPQGQDAQVESGSEPDSGTVVPTDADQPANRGPTPLPQGSGDRPAVRKPDPLVDRQDTDLLSDPDPDPDPVLDRVPGPLDPGGPAPEALVPAAPSSVAADAARNSAGAAIAALRVRLEVIKTETGFYPTSRGGADDAHRGIEAFCAALPTAQRARWKTGDADGDGRLELLDPWGRPYVYWSADDYPSQQELLVGQKASALRQASPRVGYVASRRFQLFSLGPNGRCDGGAGDDVQR